MFIRGGLKEFYAKFAVVDSWVQKDPVTLGTTANTAVWSPGSDTGDTYLVELNAVQWGANTSLVTIGVDVDASGTLTQYFFDRYIPIRLESGWLGPYIIAGNDDIMAWAQHANNIDLHFRARKVVK